MEPLTTLIRRAAPSDPLARALRAILDSGLIVFTRDAKGRFAQLSEVLTDRAGIAAPRGTMAPPNMRVFDVDGRLLAGSEYPAAQARLTGQAQRSRRMRLVSDDDREICIQLSAMPLERTPDGWSVLSIAADVTDLCDEVAAGRVEIAGRGALLELAVEISRRRISLTELVGRLRAPLEALLPGANTLIALQDGVEFFTTTITNGYGSPNPEQRGRFSQEHEQRWTAERAHVNRNVQDTDIYGASVVAEMTNPVRSIVIAPLSVASTGELGAIVAFGEKPGAFSDDQIASLELAARLAGTAFDPARQATEELVRSA